MKLYTYFRSSAAYRVRIALNLKGLSYEAVPVHLLRGGGEQLAEGYRKINPSASVPTLQDDSGTITQSMAILEYLEETHPDVPLLPQDPLGRAHVRELAQIIGCDIHPLNNLRVLRYLVHQVGVTEEVKNEWYRHWVKEGLAALEAHLARDLGSGRFCHGATPTLADCFLVPQVFNAQRFDIDIAGYPNIDRINTNCLEMPAFQRAHPSQQPDAE
jgi:maleylacetoacetate isomerase